MPRSLGKSMRTRQGENNLSGKIIQKYVKYFFVMRCSFRHCDE